MDVPRTAEDRSLTLGVALVGGATAGAAVGGCMGGVGAIPGAAIGVVTATAVWGVMSLWGAITN